MSKDTELQRLEKFVEKLLARFSDLKAEKVQLEKDLSDSETKVAELENNISTKDTERTEISQRVNKIVEQIEDWELNLDDGDVEASLDEEATDEDDMGEDEGRVQHNLFSVAGGKE